MTIEETAPSGAPQTSQTRTLESLSARKTFTREELRAAGATTAKASGEVSLEDYFRANEEAIRPLVKGHMTTDRLLKLAVNSVRKKPKLRECTKASLFGAVIVCAQAGLEPDTHTDHCYLIPRCQRKPRRNATGRFEVDSFGETIWDETWHVEVQIGVKGWIDILYRSPEVELVKAVAAHENDVLDISEGTEQKIVHKVNLRQPRGEVIGFYALAMLKSGRTLFETVPLEEVERIRDTYSDAYNAATSAVRAAQYRLETAKNEKAKGAAQRAISKAQATPWISSFVEMGRGTCIKRIRKYLPTSPAMELLATLDDRALAGGQQLDSILEGDPGSVVDLTQEQEAEDDAADLVQDEATETGSQSGEQNAQIAHEQTVDITWQGAGSWRMAQERDPAIRGDQAGEQADASVEEARNATAVASAAETVAAEQQDVRAETSSAAAGASEDDDFGTME